MLEISADKLNFCKSINEFITNIRESKIQGFNSFGIKKSIIGKALTVFQSIKDILRLMVIVNKKNYTTIAFIGPNQLNYEDFLNKNDLKNCLYINYHTTKNMGVLPVGRIYNLGILVGIFNRFVNRKRGCLKSVEIYNSYYNLIFNIFPVKYVYIPCFYDQMGLSLIFDKNRDRFQIIEVQHGGIGNFFPYSVPANFRISDVIYVNNLRTAEYLKKHLYKNIPVEIVQKELMIRRETRKIATEMLLLYCSSIEVNGIHDVMLRFLKDHIKDTNFKLLVRLHPREKDKEGFFRDTLNNLPIEFEFDNSPNWLNDRNPANLIVITPWSSVVEEAFDNNIVTIIIDPFGEERFHDLIDNRLCYYSTDLNKTLKEIQKQFETYETL